MKMVAVGRDACGDDDDNDRHQKIAYHHDGAERIHFSTTIDKR
jgi:hypothetical protein